mgnify:CR=1 FL=1|tara:strand:- start:82807 stop:83361 length:555 start_codon:yes stop_codon:yes gene_type:complete
MEFVPTDFDTAWLIRPQRYEDERGFFTRTWCQETFKTQGLSDGLVQCSTSYNRKRGTLRGMHYQVSPHQEAKLVRCTRGAIFDVIVDVRDGSRTYGQWRGFELSAENGESLYIPEGFAHGFQTLRNDTEVFYQMNQVYHADSARGFHYADSDVAIRWPLEVSVISDADRRHEQLNLRVVTRTAA